MSAIVEPEIRWSPDQMIEVTLNEPDDFLKDRDWESCSVVRIFKTCLALSLLKP